jgi:hypothetical protein
VVDTVDYHLSKGECLDESKDKRDARRDRHRAGPVYDVRRSMHELEILRDNWTLARRGEDGRRSGVGTQSTPMVVDHNDDQVLQVKNQGSVVHYV